MTSSKIILIILALSFISASIYAQYLKEQKLKQDISAFRDSTQKLTEKSPVLAGTLSLIVPGFALGQLYNGETGKFLTHTIISTACITTFFITARYTGFPVGGNSDGNRANFGGVLLFLSVITYAGNYVISVADAVVSAVNINKKIRPKKGHSDLINKLNPGFTANRNNIIHLKFTFDL